MFDSILLISFGGPEKPEDVLPFIENVLKGKPVPEERKQEVAQNYLKYGGVSPINSFMRGLKADLEIALTSCGRKLPVFWGNRNWHPFIKDTLKDMFDKGYVRPLMFFTSAYSSFSGCRQYQNDVAQALSELNLDREFVVAKIRGFFNHPYFIDANVQNIQEVLSQSNSSKKDTAFVFTAHSLPIQMAKGCAYVNELTETASLIASDLEIENWKLAYQSRSGSPRQPWLEPDVKKVIGAYAEDGIKNVLIAPIGFVCDHMEIVIDLDDQAKAFSDNLGIRYLRSQTAGHHKLFVQMIVELVEERFNEAMLRKTRGNLLAKPDKCPPDCCEINV